MPMVSSRAFGRRIIGCTITPSSRASGRSLAARAMISFTATRTASTLVRLSTTPPMSDLCGMSRDSTFTTTVTPCDRNDDAHDTASSALVAASVGIIGI